MTTQILHDLNQNVHYQIRRHFIITVITQSIELQSVDWKSFCPMGSNPNIGDFFPQLFVIWLQQHFFMFILLLSMVFKFIHFYWVIDLNLFAIWWWRHLLCFCLSLDWLGACSEIPRYIQLGNPMWMVLSSCFVSI